VGGIWGQTLNLDQIWGQTQNFGDRTLGPADLTKRRLGGRGGLLHQDMRAGAMWGIPIRNV